LPRQPGRGELKEIAAAVGETAYCQIMAGIELGRRVPSSFAPRTAPLRLNCSARHLPLGAGFRTTRSPKAMGAATIWPSSSRLTDAN